MHVIPPLQQNKMKANKTSEPEPEIFLAKGAKVMLTMNLWPSSGLCNGATEKVVDFAYKNGHQPPDCAIAVIVQFDYEGPSISQTIPSYVPICPTTKIPQCRKAFKSEPISNGTIRTAFSFVECKKIFYFKSTGTVLFYYREDVL